MASSSWLGALTSPLTWLAGRRSADPSLPSQTSYAPVQRDAGSPVSVMADGEALAMPAIPLSMEAGKSPEKANKPVCRRNAALFSASQLEKASGWHGPVATQYMKLDAEAARAANMPTDLWGLQVGTKYYRRKLQLRGTPLKPGTYPALGLCDRTAPIVENDASAQLGLVLPAGGHARSYIHGGVDPLCPPGKVVRVKVNGISDHANGMLPLVNFGPKELLQFDFRSIDEPDPDVYWARAMQKFGVVTLTSPRDASTRGDAWKDVGGSHETVNFQPQQEGDDRPVGRQQWGSLQKDCLDHTKKMGKARRIYEGGRVVGHQEVTADCDEEYMQLLWLYMCSLALTQVELFYPVIVHLVGAMTIWHCDSCYGGTYNAARLERAGGWLELDYRIPFRQCVVEYVGRWFVPFGLSNKAGSVLRMLELLPDGRGRYTEEFALDELYSPQRGRLSAVFGAAVQPNQHG